VDEEQLVARDEHLLHLDPVAVDEALDERVDEDVLVVGVEEVREAVRVEPDVPGQQAVLGVGHELEVRPDDVLRRVVRLRGGRHGRASKDEAQGTVERGTRIDPT
jgi:hypothetical protein